MFLAMGEQATISSTIVKWKARAALVITITSLKKLVFVMANVV